MAYGMTQRTEPRPSHAHTHATTHHSYKVILGRTQAVQPLCSSALPQPSTFPFLAVTVTVAPAIMLQTLIPTLLALLALFLPLVEASGKNAAKSAAKLAGGVLAGIIVGVLAFLGQYALPAHRVLPPNPYAQSSSLSFSSVV